MSNVVSEKFWPSFPKFSFQVKWIETNRQQVTLDFLIEHIFPHNLLRVESVDLMKHEPSEEKPFWPYASSAD